MLNWFKKALINKQPHFNHLEQVVQFSNIGQLNGIHFISTNEPSKDIALISN